MPTAEDYPMLKIVALNGFRVWVGEEVIPEAAWRQTKVVLLFKYLLVQKGLAVPQEELLKEFWPKMEPKAARHNFAVTLYTLRSVLNKGKSNRRRPQRIVYERGLCRFNADLPYFYDAEAFERRAEEGLGALRTDKNAVAKEKLLAAHALYRTDFLTENLEERWIIKERLRLSELYLRVLDGLAHVSLTLREFAAAADYAAELLQRDPVCEEAYRVLITALAATGKRTEALRRYKACQQMLEQEFGLLPAPETRRLYERLVSGDLV
ncbi:MAG: hypothetical protein PWR31_809 [Bacillota bacterium]|nr:hypothetical protein [Bacillota bacterium]